MKAFKQYLTRSFFIWTFFILLFAAQNHCFAITANELKDLIEKETPVTIIDARSQTAFARGHISGAINIPCSVLKNKSMPPVGNVVVYGDGLKEDDIQAAAGGAEPAGGY